MAPAHRPDSPIEGPEAVNLVVVFVVLAIVAAEVYDLAAKDREHLAKLCQDARSNIERVNALGEEYELSIEIERGLADAYAMGLLDLAIAADKIRAGVPASVVIPDDFSDALRRRVQQLQQLQERRDA